MAFLIKLSSNTNVEGALHVLCRTVSLLCRIIIGKRTEQFTIRQNFPQDSWRTLVDLVGTLRRKLEYFFGRKLEKLEIFTFLVAQLLPLCTSFDCTAVLMQQRFDNLGFYTKIYKKFRLQILEAIFYFFSSSLVLFASSDSWKKTCVKNWVFSKFQKM